MATAASNATASMIGTIAADGIQAETATGARMSVRCTASKDQPRDAGITDVDALRVIGLSEFGGL
jgi:hypothetical protein